MPAVANEATTTQRTGGSSRQTKETPTSRLQQTSPYMAPTTNKAQRTMSFCASPTEGVRCVQSNGVAIIQQTRRRTSAQNGRGVRPGIHIASLVVEAGEGTGKKRERIEGKTKCAPPRATGVGHGGTQRTQPNHAGGSANVCCKVTPQQKGHPPRAREKGARAAAETVRRYAGMRMPCVVSPPAGHNNTTQSGTVQGE